MPLFFARSALAALFVIASTCAQATVLTFEDIDWCPKTDELCGAGPALSTKGFVLTISPAPQEPYPYAVAFQAVGRSWRFNKGGSTALNTNGCSATAKMVAEDGRPFSVFSIDLAELNGDTSGQVTFTGRRADGTELSATFVLDGRPGWQRFIFPMQFSRLSSLGWAQGDCVQVMPHMADNIVLLPSLWPLR